MIFDPTPGGDSATSYLTLAEAEDYLAGTAIWDAKSDAEKEQALMLATRELDIKYRGKWAGQKATATQRLAWPRASRLGSTVSIIDADGVPVPVEVVPDVVKQATLEVVNIAMAGGSFGTKPVTRDQFLKRKKVDVLEKEWSDKAPVQDLYPYIDQILFGYAIAAGSGIPTVGFNLLLTDREIAQQDSYDPIWDSTQFIR